MGYRNDPWYTSADLVTRARRAAFWGFIAGAGLTSMLWLAWKVAFG